MITLAHFRILDSGAITVMWSYNQNPMIPGISIKGTLNLRRTTLFKSLDLALKQFPITLLQQSNTF